MESTGRTGRTGRKPKAARPAGAAAPPDVKDLLRDLLAQPAPDEHERPEGDDVIVLDRSLWDLEARYRRLAAEGQAASPEAPVPVDVEARRSRRLSRRAVPPAR